MIVERASRHDGAVASSPRRGARRALALLALALVTSVAYLAMWPRAQAAVNGQVTPIALLMVAAFVPYAAACWLLLAVPAPSGVWARVEWAVLAGGAVLFRALLFPLPPLLSRDAYRYIWDAQLTSHGLSPYLHGPSWPGYDALRDPRYFAHVPWNDVPTIYPPAAQLLYLAAHALAPHNVWAIKAEMIGFDLLAGLALGVLLRRRGQDPRRAFIYLWAPLSVVEFAVNGHVDAAAIALIALALLADDARFRGSRAVVGALIGIATLIKLYPLVFVVALARRRDWAMLGALAATIGAGYAPFWRDGLAAAGFLSTYLTQVFSNYGWALLLIRWLADGAGLGAGVVRAVGVACAAAGAGVVLWLRLRHGVPRGLRATLRSRGSDQTVSAAAESRRGGLSSARRWLVALDARLPGWVWLEPAGAAFACVALWLALSPHVFPWYVTALLPYCALYLAFPSTRRSAPLALGAWCFCGLVPLSYVAFQVNSLSWIYPALYLACLAVVLSVQASRRRAARQGGGRVVAGPLQADASSLPLLERSEP
jgi:Glycosyltransferase family 87